jgi:hypothetical protein
MKPIDFLIILIIAAILGFVIGYIRKAKKKGVRCIGCPDSGKCAGSCAGCSGNCSGCSHKKPDNTP